MRPSSPFHAPRTSSTLTPPASSSNSSCTRRHTCSLLAPSLVRLGIRILRSIMVHTLLSQCTILSVLAQNGNTLVVQVRGQHHMRASYVRCIGPETRLRVRRARAVGFPLEPMPECQRARTPGAVPLVPHFPFYGAVRAVSG